MQRLPSTGRRSSSPAMKPADRISPIPSFLRTKHGLSSTTSPFHARLLVFRPWYSVQNHYYECDVGTGEVRLHPFTVETVRDLGRPLLPAKRCRRREGVCVRQAVEKRRLFARRFSTLNLPLRAFWSFQTYWSSDINRSNRCSLTPVNIYI